AGHNSDVDCAVLAQRADLRMRAERSHKVDFRGVEKVLEPLLAIMLHEFRANSPLSSLRIGPQQFRNRICLDERDITLTGRVSVAEPAFGQQEHDLLLGVLEKYLIARIDPDPVERVGKKLAELCRVGDLQKFGGNDHGEAATFPKQRYPSDNEGHPDVCK